jgi:FHA domain
VLFHVTIGHDARDCPGRRPTEPPALVAPSDTRDAVAAELGVKLHFVLWGAACMLWAQPEHLAFAILEAQDVESVLRYLGSVVPDNWTSTVLPVWNLPSQLRLIRQVQAAPTMVLADALGQPEPTSSPPVESPATAPTIPPVDAESDTQPSVETPAPIEPDPAPPPSVDDSSVTPPHETWPPTDAETETDSPGTITRLLEELEKPSVSPEPIQSEVHQEQLGQATQIEAFTHAPPPEVRAWLLATSGPSKGRTFTIPTDGATVGRLPENSVYIPDERLSREHARIEFRDGSFVLSDLGSRNGTALNGSLVSNPQTLTSGDTIELGSNTLVVNIEAKPTAG